MKHRVFRTLKRILLAIILAYALLCISAYLLQEKLLFFPTVLPRTYNYLFETPFEEHWIDVAEDIKLNGLWFKADSSKGLVFFLHGNGGCALHWADGAKIYTSLGYDAFFLDYRGYGKSGGSISSEKQFYADVDLAYSHILSMYPEDRIVVVGFSLGTAAATRLAALNNPKQLILHAPYLNLLDMMKQRYTILPGSLLKYKFRNDLFIADVTCPISIFHGTEDKVIPFSSSVELLKHTKKEDRLFTLQGQGHNNIMFHPDYLSSIGRILERP